MSGWTLCVRSTHSFGLCANKHLTEGHHETLHYLKYRFSFRCVWKSLQDKILLVPPRNIDKRIQNAWIKGKNM